MSSKPKLSTNNPTHSKYVMSWPGLTKHSAPHGTPSAFAASHATTHNKVDVCGEPQPSSRQTLKKTHPFHFKLFEPLKHISPNYIFKFGTIIVLLAIFNNFAVFAVSRDKVWVFAVKQASGSCPTAPSPPPLC
jgi:hypothetical protein